MNTLIGTITQIQQSNAILLVDIDVDEHCFSALLIESTTQLEWLSVGNKVKLIFKETEVSLAKNLSGLISLRNRLQCKVLTVQRGELLSKITLKFKNYTVVSAITTRSVDALQICVGDDIDALIKSNEISLMMINN
ncbi:MAG: TOBE domain-containing protein [Bacteroidota bacterium]